MESINLPTSGDLAVLPGIGGKRIPRYGDFPAHGLGEGLDKELYQTKQRRSAEGEIGERTKRARKVVHGVMPGTLSRIRREKFSALSAALAWGLIRQRCLSSAKGNEVLMRRRS